MKILKETYSEEMQDFLHANKSLIEANNFDELYSKYKHAFLELNELTQLLLDAGVDPLPYMHTIAAHMYYLLPIKSINIPDTIEMIEAESFSNCKNLTEIILPNSIEYLGYGAFHGCTDLTKIKLPESIKSLEGFCFGDCRALKEIIIPNTVTRIRMDAFYNCTNLSNVTFPQALIEIGGWAFTNCEALSEITLPASIQKLNIGAFKGCSKLKSVTLPKSLQVIDKSVFNKAVTLIYEGSELDWYKVEGNAFYKHHNIKFLNR